MHADMLSPRLLCAPSANSLDLIVWALYSLYLPSICQLVSKHTLVTVGMADGVLHVTHGAGSLMTWGCGCRRRTEVELCNIGKYPSNGRFTYPNMTVPEVVLPGFQELRWAYYTRLVA